MLTKTFQEPRFPKKWIIAPATVLLVVVLPSLACLGQSRGTLTGLVTSNGKPVVVGTVVAHCSDGVQRSALLDDKGRYTIEAIPVGKVQIGVISRDPSKTMLRQQKMTNASDRLPDEDRAAGRQGVTGKWFTVPTNYELPRSSGLETIVKGTTEYHIDLR